MIDLELANQIGDVCTDLLIVQSNNLHVGLDNIQGIL